MASPFFRSTLSLFAFAALTACGGDDADVTTGTSDPTPSAAAGFTFTLDTSKAVVWQGREATVAVAVQRDPGFTAGIQFSAEGLPAGTTAAALHVPADGTSGTLTLQAAATAPHSLPTGVTVKGTAGAAQATKPLTVTVRGEAGDVDTSFGGGTLVTPGGLTDDDVRGVAVQADGKAVVAGFGVATVATGTDFLLVRHLRDGGLDPGFGNGGRVATAFGNAGRSDEAQAVAVQPDGKILVAGSSDQGATGYDFALARYNTDGSLDTTFGNGGRVTTSFGAGADKACALLLQPDGRIVLAGDSSQGANGSDFALARYHSDGSLDTGFGTGGKVLTAIGSDGARETVYALALQTVGGVPRLVAVGGEGDFIAAAYRADGSVDTTFGTAGIVRGLFGSVTGAARGVVVTTDNRLVLAGHRDHDFAAVRLLPAGGLDTGFGTGGRAVIAVSADNWDESTALVQQTDGKLLLGGWTYTGNSSSADTVLVRLNADGRADTAFGPGGIRTTAVATGTKTDAGRALVLQPDDRVPTVRVLQAGEANGSDLDVVLMRHWL
ncbi:hypothetical protein [Piscinibacter gummiphilus]|uniref:Uncharacterized protein n=1 Tax=Piscinibacter gummiphilus TaxID=946333 RepID=A0A1W6LEQ0_9BURK|nr:hypothetical protein [Piscinibacter gummiphilus]ARN22754.1 hypothetical protein A4W93_24165 [Piscinibacter gummiphilus]ATU67450.1 hypothetical protein CPZ87_24295 [Piscinibacter gummiphilus]GLS96560.1 hypothetical protein GCM10007918_38520 [Piscinibacter gummiphilus]